MYHLIPMSQATGAELQLAAKYLGLDENSKYAELIGSFEALSKKEIKILRTALVEIGYNSMIVDPDHRVINGWGFSDFWTSKPSRIRLDENQVGVLLVHPRSDFEADLVVFTKSGESVTAYHPRNPFEQIKVSPIKPGTRSILGEDGIRMNVERQHTHVAYIIEGGVNQGAAHLGSGPQWAFDGAVSIHWNW